MHARSGPGLHQAAIHQGHCKALCDVVGINAHGGMRQQAQPAQTDTGKLSRHSDSEHPGVAADQFQHPVSQGSTPTS